MRSPAGRSGLWGSILLLLCSWLPCYASEGLPAQRIFTLPDLTHQEGPRSPRILLAGSGDDEDGGDGSGDSDRNDRIVGSSLLVSGLFLCSWGIASWEMEEYQCCPARNTGNVIKIVAGIVLVNAGLMYLLGVHD